MCSARSTSATSSGNDTHGSGSQTTYSHGDSGTSHRTQSTDATDPTPPTPPSSFPDLAFVPATLAPSHKARLGSIPDPAPQRRQRMSSRILSSMLPASLSSMVFFSPSASHDDASTPVPISSLPRSATMLVSNSSAGPAQAITTEGAVASAAYGTPTPTPSPSPSPSSSPTGAPCSAPPVPHSTITGSTLTSSPSEEVPAQISPVSCPPSPTRAKRLAPAFSGKHPIQYHRPLPFPPQMTPTSSSTQPDLEWSAGAQSLGTLADAIQASTSSPLPVSVSGSSAPVSTNASSPSTSTATLGTLRTVSGSTVR